MSPVGAMIFDTILILDLRSTMKRYM